jgi:hypothetical protein
LLIPDALLYVPAQRAQIDRDTGLPDDRMMLPGSGIAAASHLASVVEGVGITGEATEYSEIDHRVGPPEERMENRSSCKAKRREPSGQSTPWQQSKPKG